VFNQGLVKKMTFQDLTPFPFPVTPFPGATVSKAIKLKQGSVKK